MAREVCAKCAAERFRRAQVEGENLGLRFAIQKAVERLHRAVQDAEAVAAMLDARLEASGDRQRALAIVERAA